VIATDGFVHVEPEAFDLIRKNLGNANMFAFGIGKSVNRYIIEGMAHVGMGEPFVITKPNEAPTQAEKFRKYIQSPVLTRIDLDFGKFDVHELEPPSIPDVLAERPVICFGKWRGKPKGSIIVTGFTGDQRYKQRFDVNNVAPREENAALRYLWARHRIKILGDYNMLRADDERVEVITELGLQYNLLTQYTSFVAIDTVVRRDKDGKLITVKQPLPLPEGVSDLAVDGYAPQASYKLAAPAVPRGRVLREVAKEEDPRGVLKTDSDGTTGKFFPPLATAVPDSETKQVNSKTFSLINGVWVDGEHSNEKEIMKIRRDSQAYKDLIAAIPELKKYFELGEKVIVNVGRYSIEIAEDGKIELTKEELKRLTLN
jgi:Ca-activated chloride channel family protein